MKKLLIAFLLIAGFAANAPRAEAGQFARIYTNRGVVYAHKSQVYAPRYYGHYNYGHANYAHYNYGHHHHPYAYRSYGYRPYYNRSYYQPAYSSYPYYSDYGSYQPVYGYNGSHCDDHHHGHHHHLHVPHISFVFGF